MTTLILNASEGRIQFVLDQDGTPLCAQEWHAPSKGTELLAPALADMLRRLNLMPDAIDRIACVAGPGSFTGLRLVLTTAAAFRRATGASVAPLNALQALAASLPHVFPTERLVRVVTHARKELVHGQDFILRPDALPHPVGEPVMWELHAACTGAPDIVLGSGLRRNRARFEEAFPTALLVAMESPTVQALLDLTSSLPETDWVHKDLDPLYLRPCDAVDNLPSIAAKRGQAPEEALAELKRLLAPSAEESVRGQ